MKSLYALIFLLATPFIAFSQSVISNIVPNFGDQFVMNQVSDAPEPGAAGADITWDFSDEIIDEITGIYTVLAPSNVEGSEDFPDATMVWAVDIEVGVLQAFMSFTNNVFSSHGSVFSGEGFSSVKTYIDPMLNFTYPLVYQNTGNDTFYGSLSNFSGDTEFTGSRSFLIDGYGTLITPYGTYNDVLRITSTTTETMTVFNMESITNSTETMWYSPDYPAPVFTILHSESYTAGVFADSSKSTGVMVSYTPATTGLISRTNENAFSIYPNPTTNQISVSFLGASVNTVLNIYSSTGKLIDTQSGVQCDQKVDVSSLSPGIYIAVLSVDGQQCAQRLFSIVR